MVSAEKLHYFMNTAWPKLNIIFSLDDKDSLKVAIIHVGIHR